MPKWIMDLYQSNRPGVLDRRNARQDNLTKILEGTNQLSSGCTSKMSSAEILFWNPSLKSSTEILNWYLLLKSSTEILRWNPPQISFSEILKRPSTYVSMKSHWNIPGLAGHIKLSELVKFVISNKRYLSLCFTVDNF